jgi:2-haloacid dehalogenase
MKNYKPINTIVFDLGGVLIDWNPEYVFRKIFDDENEMQYFLTEICSPSWNVEQDAGRSLKEGTEILCAEYPAYASQIKAFYGRWPEMLGGPISKTVQILEQLYNEKKYRLYALTNWSNETFPIACEKYPFLNLFEGIVVSGDEKLKKPDPAIYRVLQERYKVEPHQSLFIDDSHVNVETARNLGFRGHHFSTAENLQLELDLIAHH